MSSMDTRMDAIEKKLNELIDLVMENNKTPKVENHTHHHYPSYPQYTYPHTWGTGSGWGTGGQTFTTTPGTTTTFSTNDPQTNGPLNPTA